MPGTPRAPERWPESSRTVEGSLELQNGGLRALEDAWNDFEIEAFSVKSGRFLVLRRLQVTPGGVELCPRRSLEFRGRPELQNGALRALEEAWENFLLEGTSCEVWSFSVFCGVPRWLQEVSSCVSGGPWRSGESPEL